MTQLGKDSALRPAGCVLVSTQVAEQSVDIDADLLITDLAPTDMLLQRLGRLWRHDRPARPCLQPEVWIQTPPLSGTELRRADAQELKQAFGRSARVYAPYVLLRSLEQWSGREAITLPDEIRRVLEATYADAAADEPLGWQELRKQLEKKKDEMTQQALSATLVWTIPALRDEEGVQTRFSTCPMAHLLLSRRVIRVGAGSVRLDLLNGDTVSASEYGWSFDVAKAIHRHLAPVPRWAVAAGLAARPAWLTLHVDQAAAVGLWNEMAKSPGPAPHLPRRHRGLPIIRTKVLSFTATALRGSPTRITMNLTTDPWIPVVWKDGRTRQVSLREAFEHGEQIRDLAVRPHERVALMRLLVCLAQSALGGPAERKGGGDE